ncbi:MAG: CRISPR-associated RAMP protein [Thermoleophilia bacterium]|nr:CRISPR-associated RAMP protein [Thermoleophilia bacterium]
MGTADWTVCFVDLALEAVTGVRVGAARATAAEATDAPLLRDPQDRPLIPGSSLKGALRSAAEHLLRPLGSNLACDVVSDRCLQSVRGREPTGEELASLCSLCRLFGNPYRAGRLVLEDLVADDKRTIVRDGVAIDRRELKQAGSLKYDYEVAPPDSRFGGRIRIDDPDSYEIGLVLTLCDLVDRGLVTLGGGASRGLGRLRYCRPPQVTRLIASEFTRGTAPAAVEGEVERQHFAEWLEGRRA